MSTLDLIKAQIKNLYENNPNIHINISLTHPRLHLTNDPVTIKGVYPHFFRIEETSSGVPKCHTLQYTDVLTGQVSIEEMKK
ncbi:MAG: hypothetical protein IJE19_02150 [Clostridia bacterium]|nr:hypothetical protein [Clostridia bacterium]